MTSFIIICGLITVIVIKHKKSNKIWNDYQKLKYKPYNLNTKITLQDALNTYDRIKDKW